MLIVALIVLAGSAQPTPDRPDFSGRWVLEIPPRTSEDVTHRLVVDQPITRTSVRGEAMKPAFLRISIRREMNAGSAEETRLIGVIGGTVGIS